MSSFGDDVPRARLCHVVKWDDFDGYGFNLHAEKGKTGQYIGKVDEGSPSEAAGLKQGDRIVEVNDINIANETHKQVVERIKAFPSETRLLVVDQEADEYYKNNDIVIKGTLSNVKLIKTPEKNPASEDSSYARSIGSNTSINESGQKSISSDNSGSTATAVVNNNSGMEYSRENGNRVETEMENNGTSSGKISTDDKGLNLKMSAKELRAKLAARKKFDPKKESMDFKSKFDIVQEL